MSTPITAKAVVEDCVLQGSGQVTPEIKITHYRVEARMLVPQNRYSNDIYRVQVLKPEGVGYLMDENGVLMEHGRFSFSATKEIPKGTELELVITPVA